MYKAIQIIMKIACFFFFTAFIFGCDSQTEPPQAPKVITQKIPASPPLQPAPSKPPVRPPEPTQQPIPAKPETPSKTIQPAPEVSEMKIAVAQPSAPADPVKAQPTAVPDKLPGKVAAPPSPLDRTPDKAMDEPRPEISKTDAAGKEDTGAVPPETDLIKLMYDAAAGYRPAGKMDPFLPLFEEKPAVPEDAADAEKQKKKRRMPLTPLERVDLSQLKLVGIIQAPSGNRALVEEASGKGYIIKKGTFIGIHAGRVLEIQKDRVIVEEEVENVLGQFTLEKKELRLQKPPGEF